MLYKGLAVAIALSAAPVDAFSPLAAGAAARVTQPQRIATSAPLFAAEVAPRAPLVAMSEGEHETLYESTRRRASPHTSKHITRGL